MITLSFALFDQFLATPPLPRCVHPYIPHIRPHLYSMVVQLASSLFFSGNLWDSDSSAFLSLVFGCRVGRKTGSTIFVMRPTCHGGKTILTKRGVMHRGNSIVAIPSCLFLRSISTIFVTRWYLMMPFILKNTRRTWSFR